MKILSATLAAAADTRASGLLPSKLLSTGNDQKHSLKTMVLTKIENTTMKVDAPVFAFLLDVKRFRLENELLT